VGISLGIGFYLLFARAQLLSVGIIAVSISLIILLPTPSLNQGSINVLGIQGNVPRLGLDFNSRAEEVFNLHLEQSLIALKQVQSKPDLIVWPENSVDIDPFINSMVGQKISDLAKNSQTPIVVGAVLKSPEGPKNASVMWSSDGEVVSKYEKRTLTPFGEYIPLRSIAELITPFANDVDDFVKGDEIIMHKIGESKIAPIICYEIIDDSAVNSMVNEANLMLVQTNNATFADSGQSMQQLNITRIRAVEQNKWVVSISTTGVSAIIDNKGSVRQITEQNRASYVSGAVMLNSNQTLASKLGNWSSLLLILLASAVYLGKRRRSD
jgi:apolipoprotein N-acyltransferase